VLNKDDLIEDLMNRAEALDLAGDHRCADSLWRQADAAARKPNRVVLWEGTNDTAYYSDLVHPNPAGYAVISAALRTALAESPW
jgi:lysophospholipase L1-like esterase